MRVVRRVVRRVQMSAESMAALTVVKLVAWMDARLVASRDEKRAALRAE